MKLLYVVLFAVAEVVLIFCALAAYKKNKKLSKRVALVLSVAGVCVLDNIFIILSTNEKWSLLFYSICFAAIDWLLFEIFMFTQEYTGSKASKFYRKNLMLVLLAVDSLILLGNNFKQYSFVCQKVFLTSGEVFYTFEPGKIYYVHLAISYMLFVFSVLTLLYKVIVVPSIYREKYRVILFMLLIVVIVNAAFLLTIDIVIDISVIIYAVAGVVMCYYTIFYESKKLKLQTWADVLKNMRDGIVIFDLNGDCINLNEQAEKYFGEFRDDDRGAFNQKISDWCRDYGINLKEHSVKKIETNSDGQEKNLRVETNMQIDKKGKVIGCFIIIQDRTEDAKRLKEQRYLTTHDRLTNLYNREYFYEKVEERLKEVNDEIYIIVCSDIKNFKMVNDIFGIETGNEILRKMASVLEHKFPEYCIYGRLGDDKFGLFIKKEDFHPEDILESISNTVFIETNIEYPINIYLGIYEITDKTLPIVGMCDRAVMAINNIKGNYQNMVACYDEKLRADVLKEQELIGQLENAIANGEFEIFLQPQVTGEGKAVGAEALIRWRHPEKGLLVPGAFIEILEKNGFIAKLDMHVWELACMQLRKWKDEGRNDKYISVNISPRDFYYLDIYKVFTELTRKYDVDVKNLKLEITETAVMQNVTKQIELIEKLRKIGFVVEIDDFGSGYSSLNMLKDIKVDVLKIDMIFLGKTNDAERAMCILQIMINLAKKLDMEALVEGVETKEQLDFLRSAGCDLFQGYYFDKPLEVQAFEEKYM